MRTVFKAISFLLILFAAGAFINTVNKVYAFKCDLFYDYGAGMRCSNTIPIPAHDGIPEIMGTSLRKDQWDKICLEIPTCTPNWWWVIPGVSTGMCKGAWYEGICEAGDAGQSFTCPCGNSYVCPTAVPTPTPPPENDTFTMDVSEKCLQLTFNVGNLPSTHLTVTNQVTGINWCSNWIGSTEKCYIDGGEEITWTHSWQDCTPAGVCNEIPYTKTIKYKSNYVPPVCSTVKSVAPNALVWDENSSVNIEYTFAATSKVDFTSEKLTMSAKDGAQTPTCSHTGSTGNISTYDCKANGPVYPEQINYNLKWIERMNECPFITVPGGCSADSAATAKAPSSYFKTVAGDVYIKGVLNQSRFPSTGTDTLATYTFSSGSSLDNSVLYQKGGTTFTCNTALKFMTPRPFYCSTNNLMITSAYNDATKPAATNWYQYIFGITKQLDGFYTAPSTTYLGNYGTNRVILLNGSVTIPANSSCKGKYIFLINGNLDITPDFKQTGNSACLFIVNRTTTIHTFPTPRPTLTEDLVEAFIVSQDFTTESKPGGDNVLRIKGGLATEGITLFKRNLNSKLQLYPNNAAEIMEYEGARYLFAFGDILKMPQKIGIRELGLN